MLPVANGNVLCHHRCRLALRRLDTAFLPRPSEAKQVEPLQILVIDLVQMDEMRSVPRETLVPSLSKMSCLVFLIVDAVTAMLARPASVSEAYLGGMEDKTLTDTNAHVSPTLRQEGVELLHLAQSGYCPSLSSNNRLDPFSQRQGVLWRLCLVVQRMNQSQLPVLASLQFK